MRTRRLVAALLTVPVLFSLLGAQAARPLPVLEDKPTPHIDASGPSAAILSLAFSPDGRTLYAAGLDKVVRVWTLQNGNFTLKTTYRVPIGPGNLGAINAVAVSPDGKWLAMAGRAPIRNEIGFRQSGVMVGTAALSPQQNQDAGVIYVASTANAAGGKVLRGHQGEVRALAFAPPRMDKPALLVSAASERRGAQSFGGLRLWDVEAGKLLDECTSLPANTARPGLAVWHTGPGIRQVRVAVAWPEQDSKKQCYLRLWDTSPGADPLQGWQDDRGTQTVALLDQNGGARLLTGGFGDQGGRLQVWSLSPNRPSTARWGAEMPLTARKPVKLLPVSMSLISAPGGPPSHAAVVVMGLTDTPVDFRLLMVDLRSNRVVAEVPLANADMGRLPTIASGGQYLALAGTNDHAVKVLAVADVLAGRFAPKAVLAGDGLLLRQAAFVDKGRGLWLSVDREASAKGLAGRSGLDDDLIFDLEKRLLHPNQGGGLAKDAPELGEWSVVIDPDRKTVRVRQGQMNLPAVHLRNEQEVTAAALRPPAPGRPAVLAVAYTERQADRSLIMLCDPMNGKPYRQLIGHLQRVNHLAFSASRPLLVSVGDDQTVCVWSLADLDHLVAKIAGLEVMDEQKKVVVLAVEPGSAAAKAGLAKEDVLEKLAVAGGKANPITSATEFVLAISLLRPGGGVEVTVAGKGAVRLPVERGMDERNPLFSLFLLRDRARLGWIGWSPAGPYDCSGPAAEKHLGWHTNTGDPAAPVSYAAAGEYRKDYYREGILRYLAAEADLSRALEKWNADHPTKPPEAILWFLRPDGALPTERADGFLVRRAVKTVRAGINDDYPLDDKHVLRWRLTRSDGGKINANATELLGQATRENRQWQADLARVDWQRGEFQLRVGLHARPDGPELASQAVTLRYQPPAPTLGLRFHGKALETTEAKPLKVTDGKLALQIDLHAPLGQKMSLEFTHALNGLVQTGGPATTIKVAGPFPQEFALQPGLNHITVRAINEGALAGHEAEESAAADAWISFHIPHELPPRILALHVEPRPEVKHQNGKDIWIVDQSPIHVSGTIEADGVLTKAEWSAGGAPNPLTLPHNGHALPFAFDVELNADQRVPLTLRAKSQFSPENTRQCLIVYWPRLPDITIDALNSPDVLSEKLTLTGSFHAATADPFEMAFGVASPEGRVKWFKPDVDLKAKRWKANLVLFPGENSIDTHVTNKWRDGWVGEKPLKLRYRRPPQITASPKTVKAVGTNKVSLAFTVAGPAGRPLTAITVDGKPVSSFKAGNPQTQGNRWIWQQVEVPEIFVNDGDHNLKTVSIRAVSDEGESEPAVVQVLHTKPPRPPSARFLGSANDTSRRPEYTVPYRVESEQPLQHVEIRRGEEVLYRANLQKIERQDARYVLQGEAPVRLNEGSNRLELVAVNQDGRSPRAEVVVSYIPPPALIRIDQVELLGKNGDVEQVLKPLDDQNGEIRFPEMPRSLVLMTGRVSWSDPNAKALDDPGLEVVAKVGDCRQFPVALGKRGTGDQANVRSFHVPLVLIGKKNRIKIELPSVAQQQLSRREFDLACAAPETKQRLHVLIVGVDVKDSEGLKNRVLDALAVEPKDRPTGIQGTFVKKPPFEWCNLYHVLARDVTRDRVVAQLVEINNEIQRLKAAKGWLNDVVLIYYQGEDVVVPGKKERWLKTSPNYRFAQAPLERFAIPCDALPRVPGVELLLLNVAGAPGALASGSDWGGDPDAGFLRYACQDRTEVQSANPTLLTLLQEAIRKNGRLGDVVQYINEVLGQQRGGPLVAILDDDQRMRRIGGP